MRAIKILDCTLRDGGFINDWNFGVGSIESIISRLDNAGIDIIEVGFIDGRRQPDINRSIVPNTDSIKHVFENIDINKSMIVAMIDFGTCTIEAITEQKDSVLDGIRVIFKKKDYIEAIDFCAQIKEKGYKIFINPVSITSYSDDELAKLIEKINEVDPYSVSIVDTYGLMHKNELLHYYEIMDEKLTKNIVLGYHSHNNFQLGYANAIELISMDSERELMIDGSLYGMGKGAGNTCTELLALYLNENYGKNYGIDQLLEAIDVDISKEYAKKYWGYSLMHFIAASNDCHPDYVSTLINKKTLSIKSVNEILSNIEQSHKLTFNKELLEKLYLQYQNKVIDDSQTYELLRGKIQQRDILIIAPGKSIELNQDRILNFIKDKSPIVITINFINDDFKPDYVFMGNAKRYSQFFNKLYKNNSDLKIIGTSNISEANKKIDYMFNFNSLINEDISIRDNPVMMLLKVLLRMNIKKVFLAGFDGYSDDNSKNYIGEYIQFLYCQDDVVMRNQAVKKSLEYIARDLKLEFLTPSFYL